MPNTGKLDKEIWGEFNKNWSELAFESELLIAKFSEKDIEEIAEIDLSDFPIGKERERLVKTRVNQSFFRSMILSSYNLKCCITGLSLTDFLIASHIVPWKLDEKNRLNPQNGLCLNSIHDKAFDRGFITVTTDYTIKISNRIKIFAKENIIDDVFLKYENQKIQLPDKFLPDKAFLLFHNENIFND